MYSAEDYPGPALAGHSADFIAAQSIARVDPDPHNITRLDTGWIQSLQRLVADLGISERLRGRACQYI